MPWLLVFFLTPIIEIYLLIEVAGYINTLPTIALVMLTAVVGVALLKRQGLATLTRGMGRLNSGEVPAQEMAEGILLAVAGALLITPGFVTDGVGFLLLLPPTRAMIAAMLLRRVVVQGMGAPGMHTGASGPHGSHSASGASAPGFGPQPVNAKSPNKEPVTLEGDFERRD